MEESKDKMATKQGNESTLRRRRLYDQIAVTVPKGEREKWKAAAEEEGLSLNRLIITAVRAYNKGCL